MLAPENTVHVIGQATPPLYFNCSIEFKSLSDGIIWDECITDPTLCRAVATGPLNNPPKVEAGLENEYATEGNSLIVKDANFDDAGRYVCRNFIIPPKAKQAQAIIFGKPHCIAISSSDVIVLLHLYQTPKKTHTQVNWP